MIALIGFLAVCVALVDAQSGEVPHSRCVSLFFRNRTRFKACETQKCFLFRQEKPFVFLDEHMKHEKDQEPFKCRERHIKWPDLRGAFFSIMDDIPELEDALCVWAGSKTTCMFDDMVSFVGNSSRNGLHKFAVGGLMFMVQYRISNHTIPSAPMLESQLIIIGPRKDTVDMKEGLRMFWGPFTPPAWMCITGIFVFFFLMRLWIAIQFMHPFDHYSFCSNLFGEYYTAVARRRIAEYLHCDFCRASNYTQGRNPNSDFTCDECRIIREIEEERVERLQWLTNTWFRAAHLSLFVIVLFYEIAVVNFIFARPPAHINNLEPHKFVLRRETTQEYVFRKMLASKGVDYLEEKLPWKRRKDLDEVFHTVLNSKPPMFSMSYEVSPCALRRVSMG